MNGRTITVNTGDHGPVTLVEPVWCTGEHPPVAYRADVEHQGQDVELTAQTACHGLARVALASLYQRPFSTHGTRAPVVTVEFDGDHEYDAESLADLADKLVAYAVGPLHSLTEQLQQLETGR